MKTGSAESMKGRVMPAAILTMILLIGIGFKVPNSAAEEQQNSSAHFNAGVDVYTDSQFSERAYKFERGNTVYFSAWSNAYTGSGLLATPHTNFTIDIVSPENATVYHQRLTAGDDGNIQFSLPIRKNFTFGTYDVRYTAQQKGFKTITPYSPEPDVSYSPVIFVVTWGPDDIVDANDKYKFELLGVSSTFNGKDMGNGPVKFGSYVTLKAKLCPSPFSLLPSSGTYGPTNRPALEGQGPEIIINTRLSPHGDQRSDVLSLLAQNITSYVIQDSCSSPFEISSGSLAHTGRWSVTATAQWLQKNDTQHVFQSDSNEFSFVVAPDLYRSNNIMRIVLDSGHYGNTRVLDWSVDGKSILFSYQNLSSPSSEQQLGIMSLDPNNVTELDPNLENRVNNNTGYPGLYDARFSRSTNELVLLYGGNIYNYDTNLKNFTRLTQSGMVSSLDISSEGILFYNENGTFVSVDTKGENSPQTVIKSQELKNIYSGDLSPDGTKILYRKTLDAGYGWSNGVLAYYDIQSKKENVIPNIMNNCGAFPKWAPDSYHLLYHESSCGRGWPGAEVKITDLNGSFDEYIVPPSNDYPSDFMFSPDGNSILFTFANYGGGRQQGGAIDSMGGPANFYIMSLARPVPEFSQISLLFGITGMIAVAILVGRTHILKRSRPCSSLWHEVEGYLLHNVDLVDYFFK